jgi:crotonobetainyl-CoA:carnitine CoA-transferase CaiB-like acyl-CoA transferase
MNISDGKLKADTMTAASLPLSGIKVLDLTLARAGPTCVRHLADWGADVIRVEPPPSADEDIVGRRHGPDFQNLHRNKRCICIDLKTEEGREIFMRLAKDADVVVENMRPTVKHKLKVSYEDVSRINPRIVYGSLSGFGQTGPYGARAGVDQIAQGMSGLMSVTGEPGRGPMRTGIALADVSAGNILALGIAFALLDVARTGKGRWVQTSLLETMIFMLDFQASRYLVLGEVANQEGNFHPTAVPTGAYPTSDGGAVNLSASSTRLFVRMCDVLGKPEWKDKPGWIKQKDRQKDRENLNRMVGEVIKTKSMAYWVESFEAAGIPCGPIYTIDQVFADPQVQHLDIVAPVHSPHAGGDINLVASPISMSDADKSLRLPTPESGEHTDGILHDVGFSADEIADLKKRKIV